ncbi:hypothetical protein IP92_01016 [Pseudoduganella flava]|uniref:Uncharacterized protein n=1 Tax=Pseudoduganella flava TaxID=871742 RepID=A0A562PZH9_9BURK|nr:DUF5985 family protein [Pseudoduganella flava]QGZ38633.1 hypothetical protein GO485_05905 [Pseudoduganella flava]TWI49793.1 hypothetical protein IP92_01016 [Pseudoduganella flava]
MASVIYLLCAATAAACAVLLLRSYRKTRVKLLLWSGLCFGGMVVNNVLLVVDRVVLPEQDLRTWRLVAALLALMPLLYGLVAEDE